MSRNQLLFFILICLNITAKAQTKEIQTYDKIPAYGIDLADGWRYTSNDNTAYAAASYDDAKWKTIEPTKMLYELPELKNVNIGWLRLKFKVGAALGGKTLLISPYQNCASEIYLDGKLIRRYGVISADPARVVPIGMNQTVEEIHLLPGRTHVFSVRFAPWKTAFFIKNGGTFFWLTMTDIKTFQETSSIIDIGNETYVVLVAIFLLISLLHLSFYRYDPRQKANLYFAIYTIVSTVAFLLVCLQGYFEDMRYYALVLTPSYLIALMTGIWTLKALSILFDIKAKRLITAMWLLYLISSLSIIFFSLHIPYLGTLITFELAHIWLLYKAVVTRKRGAGIIVMGFIISIVMVIISGVEVAWGLELNLLISQAITGITYLAPAFGISLYLAREFALDSGLLRDKLLQVEMLSAQSLAQEQEKQLLLENQNNELETQVHERTLELQASLDSLKSTQAQLIQSEKMASLGELTAGIAHEIQNPLNFVNNFSEVSSELTDELQEELDKGELDEARAIAIDIKQNLDKINHHGKRADMIVKGMLQHSRVSTGQKVNSDVNKLIEDAIGLAYHGMSTKHKGSEVNIVTNLQAGLPLISIVTHDVGRALLNLINNALYAVLQRANMEQGAVPTIKITTGSAAEFIVITVEDNGLGIPDSIRDKIMQPFFTTKPTGEGTGLGLSLSYDIIVKGHNGKIEVRSQLGEGSIFTIFLPI